MAATNAPATDKEKEVTTPPVAAATNAETTEVEEKEADDKSCTAKLQEHVSDKSWWESASDAVSACVKTAGAVWNGGEIPDIFAAKPEVKPAVLRTAATNDATNPPTPPEKKGWGDWIVGGISRVWDGAKAAADTVANAVSDGWKKVFGDDAKLDLTDANKDGKTDKVTVTESDGDIITTDADKTVIEKKDGTRVTRDNGETTVEKNGITITRDRQGRETFKLKDGTTGRVGADGNANLELQALREQITKDGVYGEIKAANGYNKVTYFNTHHNWNRLTREQRDHDVVQAGDQTAVRIDKDDDIRILRSPEPGTKNAFVVKEGSEQVVQVAVVDGQRVIRVGKMGPDGKPDLGSFKTVNNNEGTPDWFQNFGQKRCHGRRPGNTSEALDAMGITAVGGDVSVRHQNITLGPSKDGGGSLVRVQRGDGENQFVELTNVGGKQQVNDLEHKQVTKFDGANHDYSYEKDGVKQVGFDTQNRHLQLYDEKGNLFADSTREGTRFSDGSSLGSDGSYTQGGTKYFSANAQEMQNAQNLSVTAIRGAEGHIGSFKAALGRPGTAVDVGELSGSMGSLTQALAMCIKSGNFTHLASILSNLGECQNLIARGVYHNANVQIIKAGVPDATDTLIAAAQPAPNDVAVAQLDKLLHERRASA